MPTPSELLPAALYTACDPAVLSFSTTAELSELDPVLIHPRAMEALRLGLDMPFTGYNLFVLGEAGSGRHAIVTQQLKQESGHGAPPADWCYVLDFADPTRARLLKLPCGRGAQLYREMEEFVEEITPTIAAAFESDDYSARVESLQVEEKKREEAALRQLGQDAQDDGVALLRTPHGFVFAPMKDAEATMSPEEFAVLSEEKKNELEAKIRANHEKLHKLMNEFPHWRREVQMAIKELGSEVLGLAVGHLIEDIKRHFADLPEVTAYLDAVLQDILESGQSIHESTKGEEDSETTLYTGTISAHRYRVNLLVENPASGERPIVYEDNPTLQNLVGRIEHHVHMGTLLSNFTLIKAGALHRANGGFLVLDARKLLSEAYAWDGLKRMLRARQIRIESLAELVGLSSTVQLEPEPVPLDLKVILIGERMIYYLLAELDPDFLGLFKINADFESEITRTPEGTAQYARLIATLARRDGLRPLTSAAVARVIEHAARLAGDAEKLTTQTQPLSDLMRESEHVAGAAGASTIEREHVEKALLDHRHRNERIQERYQEEILRGQLLIATDGLHVGQVNGLAVAMLGESTFAHPVRITATVRMGEGEIIDIEREVELGGPIHSKGVLILSSFLAARFGWAMPLSLRASLVFEQSYGGVEGDSASLAELAALLSTIAAVPIRQSVAVTGSVNQFGIVQPVGGINEKIEGFFQICAARGLTGTQGVIIPAANVCHLMLEPGVVAAVREGRFHIWAVRDTDEAMELLTGLTAGEPNEKGEVPEGTLNFHIALQLAELAQMHQEMLHPTRPRKARKKKAAPAKSKPPAG
ncbi:MAG: ATP-binding protein [Rhodocyclaceae bacterium]|nr:MAG: ATP-binding protein [Rhodocyclaceae bacterium]